ncbi:MAG TPA: acetamidase/formamidase family protein [Solirubrobacterales bacterium]|jgi:acetamidase/formamidase
MADHVIDAERIHHKWDNGLEPTLVVQSGDSVTFELAMSGRGQVERGAGFDRTSFDIDTLYNLLGPVFVEGARPGDTLEVDVLSLTPGEWGWTAILPEEGLLPDDFPEPFVKTFELGGRSRAELAPGVEIPVEPFLGTMGTHPDEAGVHDVLPPHKGGGNIDARHLKQGATLWLPVWCDGGLFSCGDPHAAQGDGEVCVSAIECDMHAVLRFDLRKSAIGAPRFFVPSPLTPRTDTRGHLGTMGIGPDLMEGAKTAVREMIELVVERWGLGRRDAYLLCSLAGDLKILEIVDDGAWNVGFTLPLEVFEPDG